MSYIRTHRTKNWFDLIFLSCIVCLAGPTTAFSQSQTATRISGYVTDAESGEPLAGVNVFIAGSTIGSATDSDGLYSFAISYSRSEYEVVASMVGFTVEKMTVSKDDVSRPHDFSLKPVALQLGTVEITASNAEWKQNLDRFRQIIFSTTRNGENCILLNSEVLDFSYDAASGVLRAHATRPLFIDNQALGYEVVMHDARFVGTPHTYQWEAFLQFTDSDATSKRQQRRWDKARRKAYAGSSRHYFASLSAGKSQKAGFQTYYVSQPGMSGFKVPVKPTDHVSELIVPSREERQWVLVFDKSLLIENTIEREPIEFRRFLGKYGFSRGTGFNQLSWLTLLNDSVRFDQYGNVLVDDEIQLFGYWAWERLGEVLPADYVP